MERAVPLLVLGLQVFLLISGFTSTDGVSLRTAAEYSPAEVEQGNVRSERVFGNRRSFMRKCRRDGLCVRFRGEATDFDVHPPPPPPPRSDSDERMDEMETEERRGNSGGRFTSNCSRRPGGCGVLPRESPFDDTPPPPPLPPAPGLQSFPYWRNGAEMGGHGPKGYPGYRRPTSNCSFRPGGCGLPGMPGPIGLPPNPPPPPPPLPDLEPGPRW